VTGLFPIQLPKAVEEQFTMEVPTGFVQTWHGASKTQADATVIGITFVIMVTAKFIVIGAYIQFNHFFRDFINSKRKSYYHYFWAAQVLVVAILFLFLPVYLRNKQHNIAIVLNIYIFSVIIDLLTTLCVCFYLVCSSEGKLLPVPLSTFPACCLCHCCSCYTCTNACICLQVPIHSLRSKVSCLSKGKSTNEIIRLLCSYQFFMNLVCHILTFFLVDYVMQSLPNVLIAYYAYPTRSLIRLSFIQISLVCLLLSVATFIYLLETLSWQCYIWYYNKSPEETEQFDSVKDIEVTIEIQNDTVYVKRNKANISLQEPLKACCTTLAQILAIIMILLVLPMVLVIIGTLIFKQTEDNDTLKGLLTILPTILGNVIIYITKQKLFHPNDFKFKLKKKN
jgi:hypothetical protein